MGVEKLYSLFRGHVSERESWDVYRGSVTCEKTEEDLAERMNMVLPTLDDEVIDLLI